MTCRISHEKGRTHRETDKWCLSWDASPWQNFFFQAKFTVTPFTHAVHKFVFGKLKISSLRVTTDSDTVFREKSIGEGENVVNKLEAKRVDLQFQFC